MNEPAASASETSGSGILSHRSLRIVAVAAALILAAASPPPTMIASHETATVDRDTAWIPHVERLDRPIARRDVRRAVAEFGSAYRGLR